MASIFQKVPVYITAQEVIDSTSKPALALLTVAEIEVLIYKAQREVDAYLVATFRPAFVSWQEFLFPVLKDWVSFLPDILKEATLYVVEQIFVSGDTISSSVWWWDVLEEKTWPHTIKYSEGSIISWLLIPDIAKKLLDQLRNAFTWIVI
jgi:hypothetical protein